MNKIKILLLDDHPHEWASTKELKSKSGINEEGLKRIQAALGKTLSPDEIKSINRNLNFPILHEFSEGIEYFEIKWLKSETFAKNYFHKMNYIESKYGQKVAEEVGYIPDIVVIDYDLDNDAKHEEPLAFREFDLIKKKFDPCYHLDEYLKKHDDKIKEEIERFIITEQTVDAASKNPTIKNRKGLYCGALITNKFRLDAPCVGISSTYVKSNDKKNEGGDSELFEWFLDDNAENTFIDGIRESKLKGWNQILDKAMSNYRKSILRLITLNKIQIDLNELIALLDGKFLKNEDGEREYKYFTFRSVYGKREIPLEGIFIDQDITEITTVPSELSKVANGRKLSLRDVAIWEFGNDVKTIVLDSNNISHPDMKYIIDTTNSLIKTFDSVDFKRRMLLAYYYGQVKDDVDKLFSEDDKINYRKILDLYTIQEVIKKDGTKKNEIINPKEFSLTELGVLGKSANKKINRLVTFFMATKLWKRHLDFLGTLKRNSPNSAVASEPPKREDLILALFPIWTKDVALFEDGGGLNKLFEDNVNRRLETLCGFAFRDIIDENGIDMRRAQKTLKDGTVKIEEIMSFGEFMLVKSYAISLNFNNLPFWLENDN